MPLILGTNSIKDTAFDVANSCRFNDDSSDYMHITRGSAGNQKTFTISMWIKRCQLGSSVYTWTVGADGNNNFVLYFDSNDQLEIWEYKPSAYNFRLKPKYKFRDVSAWYHLCVAFDTTQSTSTNRVKVYVNGTQLTDFDTSSYPSLNYDTFMNSTSQHWLGRYTNQSYYFDGYICEMVVIDGQQLDPTSFGEFDSDSPTIWKPKDVSGLTFGTNGFYLDFEDSSALGNDANGGSDFTVVNLTSLDQSTDTCTNNFATLNSNVVIGSTSRTFEEGNLSFKAESNNWTNTYSTLAASQGKWYAEMNIQKLQSSNGYAGVGILGTNHGNISGAFNTDSNSAGIELDHRGGSNVNIMSAGSNQGNAGEDFEQGKIVGLAVDMDNRALYISENGTYLTVGGSVGNPTSGSSKTGAITIPTGIDFFAFAIGGYSTDFKGFYNFGSPAYSITSGNSDANGHGNFEYSVPSGYFTLCTKNLAENG